MTDSNPNSYDWRVNADSLDRRLENVIRRRKREERKGLACPSEEDMNYDNGGDPPPGPEFDPVTDNHLHKETCEEVANESNSVVPEENPSNAALSGSRKAADATAECDSDNESLSKNPDYWNNWHLYRRKESDYPMTRSEEASELRKIDERLARNPQTPSSLASIPPPIETTPGGTRRWTIRDYEGGRIDVEAIQRRMFGPYNVKFEDPNDSSESYAPQDSAALRSRPSRHARQEEDINLNINVRVNVSMGQDDNVATSTTINCHGSGSEKDTGGASQQQLTALSNHRSTKNIDDRGSSKQNLFDKHGHVAVIGILSFALGYALCLNMQR